MNPTNYREMRLWYKQPAAEWVEALPIGNGRLGAMVFGQVWEEELQLNEDSLWYGGPVDRNNPDARKYLGEIRRLIFAGEIQKAERLATLTLSGTPESQRHYLPLGNLSLRFMEEGLFSAKQPSVEHYQRELDLNEGLVHLCYQVGGNHFVREYFASAVHQVLVVRLTSTQRDGSLFLLISGGGDIWRRPSLLGTRYGCTEMPVVKMGWTSVWRCGQWPRAA